MDMTVSVHNSFVCALNSLPTQEIKGSPVNPGLQAQTTLESPLVHWALVPHGEGSHGSAHRITQEKLLGRSMHVHKHSTLCILYQCECHHNNRYARIY